jgi:hypothetical protein
MISGPVGPRSAIASKMGFFASLINVREAKKVSAIWHHLWRHRDRFLYVMMFDC